MNLSTVSASENQDGHYSTSDLTSINNNTDLILNVSPEQMRTVTETSETPRRPGADTTNTI